MSPEHLRKQILAQVAEFADVAHQSAPFVPGQTRVPVSGRVYGREEMQALVESALDFWLTTGRFNDAFERRLAEFLDVRYVLTTNSGSSANLLAVAALTSPKLGERRLRPGDEVISVAASFPTTVNPLLLYGLVPVFVDIDIPTYNIDPRLIEQAVSEKTRAIMLAHTLGNPFDVDAVRRVAREHNLWLIEDCCDALGSTYRGQRVGGFGDIGTLSFYPAHHITMGEGGAVFTRDSRLKVLLESFRDWGRDCYCAPGKENTCGKRFGWQLGQLPPGYDHKYIYSHIGYNLKITDMQAAVGLAQLDRLSDFIEARKRNFSHLAQRLGALDSHFILPQATRHADPSWFGFPITVREGAPFERADVIAHLRDHQLDTRMVFAGNITRQPYFEGVNYRVAGELTNTDTVMHRTFWVGVYPGLTAEMLDYLADTLTAFVNQRAQR